jgi:hypothetical protein
VSHEVSILRRLHLSEQDYKDKIEETLRQLGIEPIEE